MALSLPRLVLQHLVHCTGYPSPFAGCEAAGSGPPNGVDLDQILSGVTFLSPSPLKSSPSYIERRSEFMLMSTETGEFGDSAFTETKPTSCYSHTRSRFKHQS